MPGLREVELSGNRATAMIFFRTPAFSAARRALRAKLGPIFPPAPKMSKSPSSCAMAAISASDGRERNSSSSGTDLISVFICMLNLARIPRWHKPFHRFWVGCCPEPCVPAVSAVRTQILPRVRQRSCLCSTNPKTSLIETEFVKCVLSQDERLSLFVRHTGPSSGNVCRLARNSKLPLMACGEFRDARIVEKRGAIRSKSFHIHFQ